MDRHCPICKNQLFKEQKVKHVDYHCYPPKKDHHYAERLIDETKIAMKVRISPSEHKIFFSQNFEEQTMEVWCQPEAPKHERIKVNSLFEPNFDNIEELFHKLKTYLIFS